jgi:hypothetical protein
MSESIVEDADERGRPAPNGELVHWMEPRPLTVGPAGISAAAASAFAVGVAAAVVVLALMHWLGPRRELPSRIDRRAA